MPIRVTCQCGHSLAAPDSMAGKSGKCPKCQQLLKIPAANPAAPGKSQDKSVAAKLPATAAKAAPTATPNALDNLFDAAGLSQRKGKFCPACDAPVQVGAVLCVKCGFNFQEGTKLDGFQSAGKKEFGNVRLNEAATMMAREQETETRLLNTGSPWWFLVAGLAGLLVFIGGALIKMDAATTGEKSKNAMMARIQTASMFTVLCASAGAACLLIASFSYLAILATSFFESAKQGFLCLLVPLYIIYYMFSRIRSHRLGSTVIMLWVTAILAGLFLGYSLPKI